MTWKFLRRIDPSCAPLSSHTPLVTIRTGMGKIRFAREDAGQTVVLVALMFTVLMGFAALGIDVGRFYSERRFIQDAVDSAALACAYKYAQGGNVTDAWNAGDAVLQQRNLKGNPLGVAVTYAAQGSEVYDPTVDDHNLISGIKPVQTNGRGCRVAITVDVPTFLIKIVSPALNTIKMTTMGYAKTKTGFLPSVVNRWANPPGPGNGNINNFIDHVMAEGQDYSCTITNTAGCNIASESDKGREFVIFGQQAKATNDSSFRGYIGLDIRDFTNTDGSGTLIHEQTSIGIAYNQVAVTATVNTLKDFESAWINEGYPGPDICVVQTGNFLPCAQLAVLNGSSSGIFVEDYENRFHVGDKLLLQLYDGLVKTVPDFTIATGTINLPQSGTATSSVVYTYSPQFAASGAVVTTSFIPDDGTMTDDTGTSTNPFLAASGPCATLSSPTPFSANPTLPNQTTYTQTWNTITTSGCDKGIYQAWLRGTSSAPYTSRIHEALVNVNVGGQARDFSLTTSDSYEAIASPGIQANYLIKVTTSSSGSTRWTGSNLLTLSWAKCPTTTDPSILPPEVLVCGIDGNFSQTTVTNVDPGEDHTLNVQTFLARTGEVYKGWVRVTGLDDVTNKRVTHLLPVTLEVALVSGGATQYADVLGYAVFEVTRIDSNDVYGQAITGAYLDPNDPALAVGRKIGLVPWEEP
jgi:Flp pilus assembly protein TadG